jgi:hypothetical protein
VELTTNLYLPCDACRARTPVMYYRYKDAPSATYFETEARCERCIIHEKFTTSKTPTTPKTKIRFLDGNKNGVYVEK